ncbi:hypothetical protein Tco_0181910, partial [Tanacetum coccineum]
PLTPVPEEWLSVPFLVASRAAKAALTPSSIIAWSWALVTVVVVVVVAVGAGVVVTGVDLVAHFGAIFFNHKKIQYPLDFIKS